MSRWIRSVPFLVLIVIGLVVVTLDQPKPIAPNPPAPAVLTEYERSCPVQVNPTSLAAGEKVATPGAEVKVRTLPGNGTLNKLRIVGGWSQTKVADKSVRAVQLRKRDAAGAGFVAFAAAVGRGKDGGGMAVTACPPASSESWFLGAGSSARHRSTLVLTNLGSTSAVVDIDMFGTKGPVDLIDGDGLVVDARTTRHIKLEDIAAGEEELAVHVLTRRGSVSSSLRDTSTAVFSGSEWIPSATAPAARQTVSGVPSGAPNRELILTNPGESTITVEPVVAGKDGPIVADDFDKVTVPAQSTKSVDVPASVGAEALSLDLRSKGKFTAAVRVSSSKKDFAYAVAVEPIRRPAVVPLSIASALDRLDATLAVTAGRRATTVRVEAFGVDMSAKGSQEFKIAAGRTKKFTLTKKGSFKSSRSAISYVVVTPSHSVHGAVTYAGGTLSILPLVEVPTTVLAPQVSYGR